MKFFIASSRRNKNAVRSLTDALTARGHVAHSFVDFSANLAVGMSISEEVKELFHFMEAWDDDPLRDSDAVILLEPADTSSIAQASIAEHLRKSVILIGFAPKPEGAYRICGKRYPNVAAFLVDLMVP